MDTIAAGAERPASAEAPRLPAARPPFARRTARTALLAALVAALVAAGAPVLLRSTALRAALAAVGDMRWGFLPFLLVPAVLHYVFAAIALRGASGRALPLREATLAQFTAAAANRVTPGGFGAAAVNTRYLVCRGLAVSRAAVAVAVQQAARPVGGLALMVAALACGGGGGRMAEAVTGHAARLVPPVPVLAVAGVLLAAAVPWARRALRSAAAGRATAGFADLRRRPRDLAVTLAASAAGTLVLGAAFALSALAVPGTGAGPADAPALLAAYLAGATAGAAVPVPGGIGSTEAALVAALAAGGVPPGPALHAVLVFRAVTFWAPVPVGVLACRTLRR
ncbi:lysylphosphatidylglycerol synthase domain-containing protein [Actinomadura physcomitrii]|uniref:lysylphosphatidylglycerol synthase domain-containing protein n=1 Tax=Actinomadura physcomitrii TaxID=2650748 RepID=UPI00136A1180|nr:lysylphosphatidylglycerol synthase domain-containing protein [Actinomadura physcomitrii]